MVVKGDSNEEPGKHAIERIILRTAKIIRGKR